METIKCINVFCEFSPFVSNFSPFVSNFSPFFKKKAKQKWDERKDYGALYESSSEQQIRESAAITLAV